MASTEQIRDYWDAQTCGTGVTNEVRYTRAYFDAIEDYRYTESAFIHAFAQFTRWHGKDVLEVGVGAGTDFLQFVRAGARAHGVDLTPAGAEHVRERLATYDLSAESVQAANAEALPFPDASFDLVYSFGVIHHAERTERCFAEIARVTRPGGSIKVMVYNRRSLYALAYWLRFGLPRGKSVKWAIANHVESPGTKAYTEAEMRRMVEANGCRVVSVSCAEQRIRPNARFSLPRRFLRALTPQRWLWFMMLEIRK